MKSILSWAGGTVLPSLKVTDMIGFEKAIRDATEAIHSATSMAKKCKGMVGAINLAIRGVQDERRKKQLETAKAKRKKEADALMEFK
eukprot:1177509-Alexandrium_andersonii.AAC.1